MKLRRTSALTPAATLLFTLTLASCAGTTPRSTVKAFYAALENGKPDAAIELLSAQMLQLADRRKLRVAFQEQTRQLLAKGGIKTLEITNEKVAGEVATVTVRIVYGNGTEDSDDIDLVKEKGRWKIQDRGGK